MESHSRNHHQNSTHHSHHPIDIPLTESLDHQRHCYQQQFNDAEIENDLWTPLSLPLPSSVSLSSPFDPSNPTQTDDDKYLLPLPSASPSPSPSSPCSSLSSSSIPHNYHQSHVDLIFPLPCLSSLSLLSPSPPSVFPNIFSLNFPFPHPFYFPQWKLNILCVFGENLFFGIGNKILIFKINSYGMGGNHIVEKNPKEIITMKAYENHNNQRERKWEEESVGDRQNDYDEENENGEEEDEGDDEDNLDYDDQYEEEDINDDDDENNNEDENYDENGDVPVHHRPPAVPRLRPCSINSLHLSTIGPYFPLLFICCQCGYLHIIEVLSPLRRQMCIPYDRKHSPPHNDFSIWSLSFHSEMSDWRQNHLTIGTNTHRIFTFHICDFREIIPIEEDGRGEGVGDGETRRKLREKIKNNLLYFSSLPLFGSGENENSFSFSPSPSSLISFSFTDSHDNNIPCVCYSPCGHYIATASIDGHCKIIHSLSHQTVSECAPNGEWGWNVKWIKRQHIVRSKRKPKEKQPGKHNIPLSSSSSSSSSSSPLAPFPLPPVLNPLANLLNVIFSRSLSPPSLSLPPHDNNNNDHDGDVVAGADADIDTEALLSSSPSSTATDEVKMERESSNSSENKIENDHINHLLPLHNNNNNNNDIHDNNPAEEHSDENFSQMIFRQIEVFREKFTKQNEKQREKELEMGRERERENQRQEKENEIDPMEDEYEDKDEEKENFPLSLNNSEMEMPTEEPNSHSHRHDENSLRQHILSMRNDTEGKTKQKYYFQNNPKSSKTENPMVQSSKSHSFAFPFHQFFALEDSYLRSSPSLSALTHYDSLTLPSRLLFLSEWETKTIGNHCEYYLLFCTQSEILLMDFHLHVVHRIPSAIPPQCLIDSPPTNQMNRIVFMEMISELGIVIIGSAGGDGVAIYKIIQYGNHPPMLELEGTVEGKDVGDGEGVQTQRQRNQQRLPLVGMKIQTLTSDQQNQIHSTSANIGSGSGIPRTVTIFSSIPSPADMIFRVYLLYINGKIKVFDIQKKEMEMELETQ